MTNKEIENLTIYFCKRLEELDCEFVQISNEMVLNPRQYDNMCYLQMIENRAEYRRILVVRQDLYNLLKVTEQLKKSRARGY